MLKTLTLDDKKTEPVQHALKIRDSLAQGNYARFFKLYRNAPNMGSSLIDVFIDKLRLIALQKLAVGYLATNIDLGFLANLLAFDDQAQCEKFLLEQGKQLFFLMFLQDVCSQEVSIRGWTAKRAWDR
jgi:SAC3 family protein LENG8/THP3